MAKETSLKSWGKLWGQILLPIPHFSLWWKFGDGIWPRAANSVPGLLGVYLSTQRNNSWHSDIPVHSFCSGGKKEISLLATRKSNRTEVLPVICPSRVSNNLYEVPSNAEWFSLIPTVPLVCDAFHRSHFSTTKQQRICWENPNISTRLQNLSWQVQGVQSQLPALLVAPHQHQWGDLKHTKAALPVLILSHPESCFHLQLVGQPAVPAVPRQAQVPAAVPGWLRERFCGNKDEH